MGFVRLTLQCLWNIGVFLRDSGVKFDPEILPLISNHWNSTSLYENCVCYNDWKRVKDCVSVISHTRSAESYCQIWRCSSLFLPDPGNGFFSLCSRPHSSDSDLCEKHTSCHTWTYGTQTLIHLLIRHTAAHLMCVCCRLSSAWTDSMRLERLSEAGAKKVQKLSTKPSRVLLFMAAFTSASYSIRDVFKFL